MTSEVKPIHPCVCAIPYTRAIRVDSKSLRLSVNDALDWFTYPKRPVHIEVTSIMVNRLVEKAAKKHAKIGEVDKKEGRGIWSEGIGGKGHHTRTADLQTIIRLFYSVDVADCDHAYRYKAARELCRVLNADEKQAESLWTDIFGSFLPIPKLGDESCSWSLQQLVDAHGDLLPSDVLAYFTKHPYPVTTAMAKWAATKFGLPVDENGTVEYKKAVYLDVLICLRESIRNKLSEEDAEEDAEMAQEDGQGEESHDEEEESKEEQAAEAPLASYAGERAVVSGPHPNYSQRQGEDALRRLQLARQKLRMGSS